MPRPATKRKADVAATSRGRSRAGAKSKKPAARGALPDTRGRLKQNARLLFATRGFEGVTVREILKAAREKNGASISYYFGSKEGLIEEIIAELFSHFDARWSAGLKQLELERRTTTRDLISMIVAVATNIDQFEEPTSARLAEAASHQRFHVVLDVMKRQKLVAYDKILARITQNLPELPSHILRQRLIFLTRYFSTVFALYETTRVAGTERQKQLLGVNYDLGNVIDTAVGLLNAEVKDGEAFRPDRFTVVPFETQEVAAPSRKKRQ